ncbi:MAG: L-lactate permease [Pasteurellaceae bacterium]|nr:L-lactate permease [Pasteurellaceae bacterium]
MPLFFSLFPIILLIYLMVKRNAWPSYIALPSIAMLVLLIQLFYFNSDFTLVSANIVSGLVAVLTPVTVIFGAVLFNRFSEISGVTDTLRKWLGNISSNPIAQIMIIGWAFAFMIEGASGFGTPAAIAAPILVGLGFNPLKVAVLALIMNSVPVSFGAVGTPTWFGFGPLNLSEDQTLQVGAMTAFIHSVAALIVPVIALRFMVSWKQIRQNILYIYISVFSCVIPYFLLALVNYEFPSLVGGAIGLLISVLVANKGIGLAKVEDERDKQTITLNEIIKALLPTGILIAILVITRIHQLPFKAFMNDASTWFSIPLGFANLDIGHGLVFTLKNIFGTMVSEKYKLLYVPALIPFVVTVLIALPLFKISRKNIGHIFLSSFNQSRNPLIALLGALIMVNLMLIGGDNSMVKIIGKSFADITGEYWLLFSSYLGAVGAFFSGSNTVSNLTFGSVQLSTAEAVGLSSSLILALQSVGGAMGNMICINNIVAVCSVLNIKNKEGNIIKQTAMPMFIYGVIAALTAIVLVPIFF